MHTIAVLGGSSVSSPELVAALAAVHLGPARVVLHGRSQEKLDVVAAVCRGTAGGSAVTVEATTDLQTAARGADIILNQVRVGGYRARAFDETFPLAFDIPGEETMGPGGFANSLRTVPVVLEIARAIASVAPDAWLVNLTNPSSVVQYALARYSSLRTIGVCDSPVTLVRALAELLAVDPDDVHVDYVGMHHFGWITRVWRNGIDVTSEVLSRVDALPGLAVAPDLVRGIGAIPHPYLNYILAPKTMLENRRSRRARAEELLDLEAELLEEYRRYAAEDRQGYPDALRRRRAIWYGRIIVPVIAALLGVKPATYIVNVSNGTTVPWLPSDAIVEVPCAVDRAGPRTQARSHAPKDVVALTQANCAYEQLLVEAIVEHSYATAWRAMTLNALVRDASTARQILDLIWPHGVPREEARS